MAFSIHMKIPCVSRQLSAPPSLPPPLAFLEYLHHAVPSSDGGPSPHPPPGGHLTEQLGQLALHLRLKHFILELLLDNAQENYIYKMKHHQAPKQVSNGEKMSSCRGEINVGFL